MTYDIDPYVILGVAKSASQEDIERTYAKVIDRVQPAMTRYPATATGILETIKKAYNMLSDPVYRKTYDTNVLKNTDENKDLYFSMRVTSSKQVIIPLPEEQIIYLLVEIIASSAARKLEKRDANLNLTLVIDRSNSMDDERRMDKVKAAAQTIITGLTEQDCISIVAFNDRPSVVIPATYVQDKMTMRSKMSMLQPAGGTEIYKGLLEGVKQNRQFLNPKMVNHIVLLTDGRTYNDEDQCLELARQITDEGIAISAMGLGSDWNDEFLDKLASITGGSSQYIKSVNDVPDFLDNQIRRLSSAFAERVQLSVVPEPHVNLEMAFQLSPSAQPLTFENGVIALSSLQSKRPITALLQFQLPANMQEGYTSVAYLVAKGAIMPRNAHLHTAVGNIEIEINKKSNRAEPPPAPIIDALSKLTLYQMQQKAQAALEEGNIEQATQQLSFLGTRLIDMGEVELGRQALAESQHIAQTRAFSDNASGKTLKYSTRALIEPNGVRDGLTAILDNSNSTTILDDDMANRTTKLNFDDDVSDS